MSHIELVCVECGSSHDADMIALSCEACGSPLDVAYRDSDLHTMTFADLRMPVPFHSTSPTVTLGEGGTPLIALPSVEDAVGGVRVIAKLEFMNPTGSFKDRGTATMLSVAMEHGVRAVVEDSSGNAGASVSAYAARAGIAAHVFAPESAPEAKLGQIRVYEAETHPTPGPREASTEAAVAFQRQHGMVYASHNLSPYFVEGTKTFVYEIATQMATAPDHIVIPVGKRESAAGSVESLQGADRTWCSRSNAEAARHPGRGGHAARSRVYGNGVETWCVDNRGRNCRGHPSPTTPVTQGDQRVRRNVARGN